MFPTCRASFPFLSGSFALRLARPQARYILSNWLAFGFHHAEVGISFSPWFRTTFPWIRTPRSAHRSHRHFPCCVCILCAPDCRSKSSHRAINWCLAVCGTMHFRLNCTCFVCAGWRSISCLFHLLFQLVDAQRSSDNYFGASHAALHMRTGELASIVFGRIEASEKTLRLLLQTRKINEMILHNKYVSYLHIINASAKREDNENASEIGERTTVTWCAASHRYLLCILGHLPFVAISRNVKLSSLNICTKLLETRAAEAVATVSTRYSWTWRTAQVMGMQQTPTTITMSEMQKLEWFALRTSCQRSSRSVCATSKWAAAARKAAGWHVHAFTCNLWVILWAPKIEQFSSCRGCAQCASSSDPRSMKLQRYDEGAGFVCATMSHSLPANCVDTNFSLLQCKWIHVHKRCAQTVRCQSQHRSLFW